MTGFPEVSFVTAATGTGLQIGQGLADSVP